jgi:NAD(P)-dependent dehydrogenase (short-subunit alcohol dehydrogenase family)
MSEPRGEAVIFGAGSGLGKALADVYRERGHPVLALTRQDLDLRDAAAVGRWLEAARASGRRFSRCIVSAGALQAGLLSDLPAEAFAESIRLHALSPIEIMLGLSRAGLCRRFVFILSGAGDFLMPGLSPYALGKRALKDFLYMAEMERSLPGVEILRVSPGGVATPFNKKARIYGGYRLPGAGRRGRDPMELARRIYDADLRGEKALVLSRLPGFLGKLQSLFGGLAAFLLRPR